MKVDKYSGRFGALLRLNGSFVISLDQKMSDVRYITWGFI